VLGALLTVTLAGQGVPGIDWSGSFVFSAALVSVGLVFTAVAAVTAQITEHSRAASGLAIAALGTAYAIRAVGDVSGGALSWLSPIGWAQRARPYVDERWSPLLLAVALTAVLLTIAVALSTRRDVGAGLRHPRPGPPAASAALGTPWGLTLRLQRGVLIGWCAGMCAFGVMYGSVIGDVEDYVRDTRSFVMPCSTSAGQR
jgi:ABC-2 type transport system permease protein